MSMLLLKSWGSSYSLSHCPTHLLLLLLRAPGVRRSNLLSSLLPCRAPPHPCWSTSEPPPPPPPPPYSPPPPPPPWHLYLLPGGGKERRPSPLPWLPAHHPNIPPGTSYRCFSTLGWSSGSGSGPGRRGGLRTLRVSLGPLLMERSGRDQQPPPYKRWKGTEADGAPKGPGGKASKARGKASKARGKASKARKKKHPKPSSKDRSGQSGTYPPPPPPPPPGGVWRHPGPPPPPPEMFKNATPGNLRNGPPPPGTLRGPRGPPPPSRNPPPAAGAWGNPPPAAGAWGNPPPAAGAWGNPPPAAGAGAWGNPPPPPAAGAGAWRNPPPAAGAWGNPPPAAGAWGNPPPPPAAGAWGNPPPAAGAWRKPSPPPAPPPPPGTPGNPEDFPPLPGSGPPSPRTPRPDSPAPQPLQRHWEFSPACSNGLQSPGGGGFDFTVMSYNILSQDLLHDNAYLYRHCDPRVLPWDVRLPNLLREIEQHDADILCLQEVQQDHYDTQLKPSLQELGYQCVYKKRTGEKPDGCALVFKSSRLSLVSAHPLEYLRPGDALLDRDNVGLVLLLRPAPDAADATDATHQSDPRDFICVANTHLLYNPRRGDIKLAQLAILFAEISRLSRLPDGSANPVVLCGDLNSTPWSPLYHFLTQGCLEFKGLPIGMVSGQEDGWGQRVLSAPIWSKSLGINQHCCYDDQPASKPASTTSPTEADGATDSPTVEQITAKAIASYSRTRTRLSHGLGLQSSYCHLLAPDGRWEITTCHSRTALTVDYILYTPDSPSLPGGRGLQLLARLSLVGHSELKAVNGLPNQHHSSDHLPILARFRLHR